MVLVVGIMAMHCIDGGWVVKPTAAALFTDGSWRSAFEVNIKTNPEIVYQLRGWMCFWLLVLNCVL